MNCDFQVALQISSAVHVRFVFSHTKTVGLVLKPIQLRVWLCELGVAVVRGESLHDVMFTLGAGFYI